MAFVNDDACECITNSMDLFTIPPIQKSVEYGKYVDYHPINTIAEGSPIEFEIPGAGEEYIDLNNSMLFVKVKVVQLNGQNLPAGAQVAPVNLFLHSLFSQVDISLNGTPVTTASDTYGYRAYIETLLSYGRDAKQTQLTSSLYYKDEAGKFDALHLEAGQDDANPVNPGFVWRNQFIAESRSVDMIGRIHADLFFQDRYIINQVNVKVRLIRSRDIFSLMGAAQHKVVIENAILYIRKVKLSAKMLFEHAEALKTTNAKYPVRRVICKSVTVPQGFYDLNHEKLFSGQLPNRIIIGLVLNTAFSGNRQHNPYNFQHFNLSEISVFADGQNVQDIKPLKIDYNNRQYIRAYNTLFMGTGRLFHDEGLMIDRLDFPQGNCLYAFDLSPDLTDDEKFDLLRTGSVRLQLKFSEQLEHPITLIIYAEYQNIIEIDSNRNVVFDFSA